MPSLFKRKQVQFPQPFLIGEVLQPSDQLSGPPLDLLQEFHNMMILLCFFRHKILCECSGCTVNLKLICSPVMKLYCNENKVFSPQTDVICQNYIREDSLTVGQFDIGATWKLLIYVHRIIESCELEGTFKGLSVHF